jgi:hypothetical protein
MGRWSKNLLKIPKKKVRILVIIICFSSCSFDFLKQKQKFGIKLGPIKAFIGAFNLDGWFSFALFNQLLESISCQSYLHG